MNRTLFVETSEGVNLGNKTSSVFWESVAKLEAFIMGTY